MTQYYAVLALSLSPSLSFIVMLHVVEVAVIPAAASGFII
jgi:hypothetical protein